MEIRVAAGRHRVSLSAPHYQSREAEFDVRYGSGVDNLGELIDLYEKARFLARSISQGVEGLLRRGGTQERGHDEGAQPPAFSTLASSAHLSGLDSGQTIRNRGGESHVLRCPLVMGTD